jgi:hypothetical protein
MECNKNIAYRIVSLLCICFLFITIASFVEAQDKKPGFFIGLGAGYGNVTKLGGSNPSEYGVNFHSHIGYGLTKWLSVMLEYEIYNPSYEKPAISDYERSGNRLIHIRNPKIFKTIFLLLSAKFYLFKGLYIKPSIGLGGHYFNTYNFGTSELPTQAMTSSEGGDAYGISLGYELNIKRQISLSLDAAYLRSGGEDSTSARRVLGIQTKFSYYF